MVPMTRHHSGCTFDTSDGRAIREVSGACGARGATTNQQNEGGQQQEHGRGLGYMGASEQRLESGKRRGNE